MSEQRQRCRAAGSNNCSGKGGRKEQQLHLSASSSWRKGDVYLTFLLFVLFCSFVFCFSSLFSFPLHFAVSQTQQICVSVSLHCFRFQPQRMSLPLERSMALRQYSQCSFLYIRNSSVFCCHVFISCLSLGFPVVIICI